MNGALRKAADAIRHRNTTALIAYHSIAASFIAFAYASDKPMGIPDNAAIVIGMALMLSGMLAAAFIGSRIAENLRESAADPERWKTFRWQVYATASLIFNLGFVAFIVVLNQEFSWLIRSIALTTMNLAIYLATPAMAAAAACVMLAEKGPLQPDATIT